MATVASRYNEKKERTKENFYQSDIVSIKICNNFTKAVLGEKYVRRGDVLIDLGAGQGGDISKWFHPNMSLGHYIHVDVSQVSVDLAERRWSDNKFRKGATSQFLCHDCADPNLSFHIPLRRGKANIIVCHMAMQYFFHSEAMLHGLWRNIEAMIEPNGFVLTTFPVRREVEAILCAPVGNSLFTVRTTALPSFGAQCVFWLKDAIDHIPEYLADHNIMIALASCYGFELYESVPLIDYCFDHASQHRYQPLAKIMKLPARSQLSREELEVLQLYQVIVLRKTKGPSPPPTLLQYPRPPDMGMPLRISLPALVSCGSSSVTPGGRAVIEASRSRSADSTASAMILPASDNSGSEPPPLLLLPIPPPSASSHVHSDIPYSPSNVNVEDDCYSPSRPDIDDVEPPCKVIPLASPQIPNPPSVPPSAFPSIGSIAVVLPLIPSLSPSIPSAAPCLPSATPSQNQSFSSLPSSFPCPSIGRVFLESLSIPSPVAADHSRASETHEVQSLAVPLQRLTQPGHDAIGKEWSGPFSDPNSRSDSSRRDDAGSRQSGERRGEDEVVITRQSHRQATTSFSDTRNRHQNRQSGRRENHKDRSGSNRGRHHQQQHDQSLLPRQKRPRESRQSDDDDLDDRILLDTLRRRQ